MYGIQNIQKDKLYPKRNVKTAVVRLVYFVINTTIVLPQPHTSQDKPRPLLWMHAR